MCRDSDDEDDDKEPEHRLARHFMEIDEANLDQHPLWPDAEDRLARSNGFRRKYVLRVQPSGDGARDRRDADEAARHGCKVPRRRHAAQSHARLRREYSVCILCAQGLHAIVATSYGCGRHDVGVRVHGVICLFCSQN